MRKTMQECGFASTDFEVPQSLQDLLGNHDVPEEFLRDEYHIGLLVKFVDETSFAVASSTGIEDYPVTHDGESATACKCGHNRFGGKLCKHMKRGKLVLLLRKRRQASERRRDTANSAINNGKPFGFMR